MARVQARGAARGCGVRSAAVGVLLLAAAVDSASGQACNLTINTVGSGSVSTSGGSGSADPQLAITIGASNSFVRLENSAILAEYQPFTEGSPQFAIRKLLIKSAGNENQVCGTTCGGGQFLDAQAGRSGWLARA